MGSSESAKRAANETVAATKKVEGAAQHSSGVVKRHAEEAVAANALLTGSFTRMARAAVTAGAGFAAAYIGIAKAKSAIEATAQLAYQTEQLHRNLGLTVKTASGLESILKARGQDATSLSMGFQTLSKQITAAETGSKRTQAAFMALGISVKDLKAAHGDLNILLPKIADGFGNIQGGSERAAVAQALLARSYKTLLPLFADGAAGFQRQIDTAQKFGATLSANTLKKLDELHAAQIKNKEASLGLQIAFTTAATPALLAMSTVAQKVAKDFEGPGSLDEKFARVGKDVGPALTKVEHMFEAAIPQIADHVGRDAPKIAAAFVRGFEKADAFGQAALLLFFAKRFGLLGPAFSAAGKGLGAFWSASFAKTVTAGATEAMAEAAGVTVTMDGATWKLAGAKAGGSFSTGFDATVAANTAAATAEGGAVGAAVASKGLWGDLGAIAGRAFQTALIGAITYGLADALENALHGSGPNAGGRQSITSGGQSDLATAIQNLFGISPPGSVTPHLNQGIPNALKHLPLGQQRYVGVARRAAITAGVDPTLFIRQIFQESGFNPNANSGKAYGIAQFTPGMARALHVDPRNPDASLEAAAQLMAKYLTKYGGNFAKALIAYNAGPGDVNLPFKQLPKETQGYLTSILGPDAGKQLRMGANTKSFSEYLAQLNQKPSKIPADLVWAQSMIGHFKESLGKNKGPELNRLQKQFGTYAAAWCAEFATEALVKGGFPAGIRTPSVATLNAFAKDGNFGLGFTKTPKPGDLVTFGNSHVAIVESVNRHKGTVQTIAGNTAQGDVSRSTYRLGQGRYISVNPGGAGQNPYHIPVFRPGAISQQSIAGHLQHLLDHLDLMVQAGLMGQGQANAQKRKAIAGQLPFLQGDYSLQALATLRGLQPPPQHRALNFANSLLATRDTAAVAAGRYMQTAGIDPNSVAGLQFTGKGLQSRLSDDKKSLNYLFAALWNAKNVGDKAGAKTITDEIKQVGDDEQQTLADIATNTRDTAEAVKQAKISNFNFWAGTITSLGQLASTPTGKSLISQFLPGFSGLDLSTGGVNSFIENQIIPGLMAQGDWPDVIGLLQQIATSTDTTAQNTQDMTDFWKQRALSLATGYQISQSQYRVFQGANIGGMPFLGGFDAGGVVPGPRGAAGVAVLHGGETVLPTHRGAAPAVHVYVSADARAMGVRVDHTIGRTARQRSVAPGH